MGPRDRFVFLDTLELAGEWPRIAELIAANDLDGAQRAEPRVPCQPDFAVRASADDGENVVVGNGWGRRMGSRRAQARMNRFLESHPVTLLKRPQNALQFAQAKVAAKRHK